MENVLIDKYAIQDIGNAIRTKQKNTTKLKPAEMAPAILSISGEKSSKVTVNQVDHIQTQVNVGFGVGTVVANSGQAVEQSVKPDNLNLQILLNPDYGWKADGYTLSKPSYVLGDDIVVTVRPALKLEDKKVQFTVHRATRINGGYLLSSNTNLPEYTYMPKVSGIYNVMQAISRLQSKYTVIIQHETVIFIALLTEDEFKSVDRTKPLKDFNLLSIDVQCTDYSHDGGTTLANVGDGENSYHILYWRESISEQDKISLLINISDQSVYVSPSSSTKTMNENFDFYKGEMGSIVTLIDDVWNEIKTLGETIGTVPLITDGGYDYIVTLSDSSKPIRERAEAFYILCYYSHAHVNILMPYKSVNDVNDYVSIKISPK